MRSNECANAFHVLTRWRQRLHAAGLAGKARGLRARTGGNAGACRGPRHHQGRRWPS